MKQTALKIPLGGDEFFWPLSKSNPLAAPKPLPLPRTRPPPKRNPSTMLVAWKTKINKIQTCMQLQNKTNFKNLMQKKIFFFLQKIWKNIFLKIKNTWNISNILESFHTCNESILTSYGTNAHNSPFNVSSRRHASISVLVSWIGSLWTPVISES